MVEIWTCKQIERVFLGRPVPARAEGERRQPRFARCRTAGSGRCLFLWRDGRLHHLSSTRKGKRGGTRETNKPEKVSSPLLRPSAPHRRPISHGSASPRPIRPHRRRAPPFLHLQLELQLFLPVPPRRPRRRRLPLSDPPLTARRHVCAGLITGWFLASSLPGPPRRRHGQEYASPRPFLDRLIVCCLAADL